MALKLTEYTFAREPIGDDYRCLIEVAAQCCDRAILIVRDEQWLDDEAHLLLEQLSDDLVLKECRSEWPGTKLLDDKADVLEYRLTENFTRKLQDAVSGLFQWVHPSRPEDLAFLRSDGQIWLGTIAHEKDAFVFLFQHEKQRLSETGFGVELVPSSTIKNQTASAGEMPT